MGCKETKQADQQKLNESEWCIAKDILNLKTLGRICEFNGKIAYWNYD